MGKRKYKHLPDWCKEAKIALIEQDMTAKELAEILGYTNIYISSVLNGTIISTTARNAISRELNISAPNDIAT